MKPLDVDATDGLRSLTIKVTVRVRGLLRVRLGLWLLGLGARLLRCRLEVDDQVGADVEAAPGSACIDGYACMHIGACTHTSDRFKTADASRSPR